MPPKKIFMIVDDDPDDRLFFKEALSRIDPDYGILEADSGRSALNLLKTEEKAPDYLFLDIAMPEMDGRTFLKAFNANKKWEGTPVIVCSAGTHRIDKNEMGKLGVAHFIPKAYSITDLSDGILEAIQRVDRKKNKLTALVNDTAMRLIPLNKY